MQVIRHSHHGQNVAELERVVSVFAGSLLLTRSLSRPGMHALDLGMMLVGAEMVRRGATGRCFAYDALGISTAQRTSDASLPYPLGIRVDSAVTIQAPVDEVYRQWRDIESLPRFMRHLDKVDDLGGGRSKWTACAPGGGTVTWEAEIIDEAENERIAWKSLPGSTVANAGSVHFRPAPGNRGTVVQVTLQYNPPAGVVGATFAKLFGEEPSQQIREDLHRMKQMMEAGEIPTTGGQPSGRAEDKKDIVKS